LDRFVVLIGDLFLLHEFEAAWRHIIAVEIAAVLLFEFVLVCLRDFDLEFVLYQLPVFVALFEEGEVSLTLGLT
jgi:hypothetical protein